jgi:hypothetical protein
MEGLEPGHIYRNQQVAGSTPAGDSIFSRSYGTSVFHPSRIFVSKSRTFATFLKSARFCRRISNLRLLQESWARKSERHWKSNQTEIKMRGGCPSETHRS